MQWDENFDIGADIGTPVANDYQVRIPLRRQTRQAHTEDRSAEGHTGRHSQEREATRNTARPSSVTPVASTECRPPT